MRKSVVIAVAALIFAGCKAHWSEVPESNQAPIRALGSTVPTSRFDLNFWQREHDTNSPSWREAKRLCGQTVLANYPNCLPVNDIVRVDQQKKADAGNRAAARNDDMFRRGYQYDFARREWLPFRQMMAAGCVSAPAYPGDPRRVAFSTWKCPEATAVPEGILDPEFRKEEENVTD